MFCAILFQVLLNVKFIEIKKPKYHAIFFCFAATMMDICSAVTHTDKIGCSCDLLLGLNLLLP